MPRRLQNDQERLNFFTLLEEATFLLRRTPLTAWLGYLTGTAPFVVYLFYFWSDMSRSAGAPGRLMESSLILAGLYAWMKVWQAIFSGSMVRVLEGHKGMVSMPIKGWLRLAVSQALIHATMPWVLLLSAVALVPLGWTYAFYHNASVLAVNHFQQGGKTGGLISEALKQSHYQPLQNHYLGIAIFCVSLLVYLNFFSCLVLVLTLSKSFTGVENAFTMNPMLFISSAFQFLVICLSYMVVNPMIKAFYVLRCFYGVSRRTGADIEASVRRLPTIAKTLAAVIFLFAMAVPASAQENAPAPAAKVESSSSQQLEQSIKDVMQGSEFQWRLPRESSGQDNEDSWLAGVMRGFADWLRGVMESLKKYIEDFFDWLFKRNRNPNVDLSSEEGSSWTGILPELLIALAVLMLVGLGWVIFRYWKQNRKVKVAVVEEAPPEINLESETLLATQMQENEWLRLANEKMASGDLRLALRALFLATLSHLGEKRLLTIARSKSNGDYVRELGWRARGRTELQDGFKDQVRVFDEVWYGWHDVNRDLMTRFEEQHERITGHAT